MYFIWAFNSLTYILTVRGTGVFRPVYEYLSIFAFTGILVGSGAGLFFDYTPPESIAATLWNRIDFYDCRFWIWKLCCLG